MTHRTAVTRPKKWMGSNSTENLDSFGQMLADLAQVSQSSVALLRSVDFGARKLELVQFSLGPNPPEINAEWEIPAEKSFECWDSDDPSSTWGTTSRSEWQVLDRTYFSELERRFVDALEEKAWFPVKSSDTTFIIVLLRCAPIPFVLEEVTWSWVLSQRFLSLDVEDPTHLGFCQAIKAFDVDDLDDEVCYFQAISLALASDFGMRWNRVWFFREIGASSSEASVEFACFSAMGEVSKDRWYDAISSGRGSPVQFHDELQRFVRARLFERDELFRTCCTDPNPLSLTLPSSFLNATMTRRGAKFQLPIAFALDDMIDLLLKQQIAHHVLAKYRDYLSDDQLYFTPFLINDRRHFALFSQPYTGGDRSDALLLSTVLVQHMATIAEQLGDDRTTPRQ